jgi:hypothetical protein
MDVGSYCFLNFSAPIKTGDTQVKAGLAAIGPDVTKLLASYWIDVEPGNENQYINTNLTVSEREYILGQAVLAAEIAANTNGNAFRPMIYTQASVWNTYFPGVTEFSYLPLWDAIYDKDPDLLYNNGSTTWRPYGGWSTRIGKQYDGTGGTNPTFDTTPIDYSVANAGELGPVPKPRGCMVTGLASVVLKSSKTVGKTSTQIITVTNTSKNKLTIRGPISLGFVGLGSEFTVQGAGKTTMLAPIGTQYITLSTADLASGNSLTTTVTISSTTTGAKPTWIGALYAEAGATER